MTQRPDPPDTPKVAFYRAMTESGPFDWAKEKAKVTAARETDATALVISVLGPWFEAHGGLGQEEFVLTKSGYEDLKRRLIDAFAAVLPDEAA